MTLSTSASTCQRQHKRQHQPSPHPPDRATLSFTNIPTREGHMSENNGSVARRDFLKTADAARMSIGLANSPPAGRDPAKRPGARAPNDPITTRFHRAS